RRQLFGRNQGEFGLGVEPGEALDRLLRQLTHRVQEALAYLLRLQESKTGAQRLGILGADGADQHVPPVGQALTFMPRGKSFAGTHRRDVRIPHVTAAFMRPSLSPSVRAPCKAKLRMLLQMLDSGSSIGDYAMAGNGNSTRAILFALGD